MSHYQFDDGENPTQEPLLSRDSERVDDRSQVGPAQRVRPLKLTLKTVPADAGYGAV